MAKLIGASFGAALGFAACGLLDVCRGVPIDWGTNTICAFAGASAALALSALYEDCLRRELDAK